MITNRTESSVTVVNSTSAERVTEKEIIEVAMNHGFPNAGCVVVRFKEGEVDVHRSADPSTWSKTRKE